MNDAVRVSANVAWLLAGSAVSQVLRVLYAAVLARYIGAAGFGQISTATALVSVLILMVNFGLDTLATREIAARPSRASGIVTSTALLRLALTVFFVPALGAIVSQSPFGQSTRIIIAIYGVTYLLDAFTDIARAVFSGFQRMQYRMVVDLTRDVVNICVSLLGIYLGWSLIAIVGVSAVASLVKLGLGLVFVRWRFVSLSTSVDFGLCKYLLINALPFLALVCISVASARLNILILSWRDTAESVGVYSAAVFVITALLIVPEMFMESIFPLFSRYHSYPIQALRRAYVASYKVMLIVGFGIGTGVLLVSGRVISLLYGPGFDLGATVLCLLSIQLYTMVGYVNGALLNATNRQLLFAVLRGSSIVVSALLCYALVPAYHAIGAALSSGIATIVDFTLYTLLCHRFVEAPLPLSAATRVGVAAVFMSASGWAVIQLGIDPIVAAFPASFLYLLLLMALGVIGAEEKELIAGIAATNRLLRPLAALVH